MQQRKINISVIGCSSIAERYVLPAIVESGEFALYSVGSGTSAKAETFAEKFHCKPSTYDDIIASPEVDAVYVSLPVAMHYEWGKKVLLAGKQLLLEKTFTDSYETAEELCTLAEQKALIAAEALMYVYHPLHKQVKAIIESGEIGRLRQIDAYFAFPYLPPNDIRNQKNLGGGAILDTLIYPLSFALGFRNEEIENISFKTRHDSQRGIDAAGVVRIDWPDLSANITYGFGFMYRNAYCVWGDQAYLQVERAFSRPGDLAGKIKIARQNGEDIIDVAPANHFGLMLKGFSDKITGTDRSSLNEQSDILRRMRIISRIYNHHYRSVNA